MNIPMEINGSAAYLAYMGKQMFYMFAHEYDGNCECLTPRLYISTDMGENFALSAIDPESLAWKPYSRPRGDAHNFTTGRIVTTQNVGAGFAERYVFAYSDDDGKSFVQTDTAAKNIAWPQAEPIYIRPVGPNSYISYVFDPWTAYETGLENHYEGILLSADRGQTWQEVSHGLTSTYGYPYFELMGVSTNDVQVLNYIH